MFTKEYWHSSANHFKDVSSLALMALFIALQVILYSTRLPVSENLYISFKFLVVAVEAAVFGPVVGIVNAIAVDIIGYMTSGVGAFFPGYTLSAICSSLTFSLLLYREKITIMKLAICKFLINAVVNVMMGSLWSSILMGKAYLYYFGKSIIKNTLLLPIEVLMLVLLFNALGPALRSRNMIDGKTKFPISIF